MDSKMDNNTEVKKFACANRFAIANLSFQIYSNFFNEGQELINISTSPLEDAYHGNCNAGERMTI